MFLQLPTVHELKLPRRSGTSAFAPRNDAGKLVFFVALCALLAGDDDQSLGLMIIGRAVDAAVGLGG